MKGFAADLRHAVRLYFRTPGTSLIAVAVLAVAMAFVGAFLSLYVDLVLRPHPGFEQSSRIATAGQVLGMRAAGPGRIGIPQQVIERMGAEMTSIEAAVSVDGTSTLVGPQEEEAAAAMVSRQFFSGLRPRMLLGTGFEDSDHAPDAEPVVVLSNRYWQERYGGDADVLGTYIEIARNPAIAYQGPPGRLFGAPAEPEQESAQFRIVGVAADGVAEITGSDPALWVPLERVWPLFAGVPEALPAFTASGNFVRRAPGASAEAVANEMTARYANPEAMPTRVPGSRLDVIDGIVGDFAVQRDAERQLEMFLAGSLLIAVVAAANVSLFLLARAPGRRRELGIRMAVGAPVSRLARQLATEAGLLVVVSAVLGLIGSIWLSLYLRGLAMLQEAEWREVTLLDWRVLGIAGGVLLVLTVLVSLAPMLGLKRIGIAASSHAATSRASLAQRVAGTAQIAVAGTLGAAAIAFGWHLTTLMFGDTGYQAVNRYVVDGITEVIGMSGEQLLLEYDRRREVIEAIPGVSAVAFGYPVPGGRPDYLVPLPVRMPLPDDPANSIEVYTGAVDDRFVSLLGFEILHGRVPNPGERSAVVLNQTLARALFGDDDVVGERLPPLPPYWGDGGGEVVGVLEDLSFEHPSATVPPYLFLPLGRSPQLSTVVEAELTAAELTLDLRVLEATGELEVEVDNVRPLEALRAALIPADRARGFLTIAAAILVVFLAAFGFYGTQRYLVLAGRREYAIRASLGAGPAALRRLVFSRGLSLGLPGMVIGALLAFIVVAFLRDDVVLREISPVIVSVWVVVGLVLLIIAASMSPARQAGRTEPAPLLRED